MIKHYTWKFCHFSHMKNDGSGIRSRIKSFGFAINGIKQLFQSEPNARLHLLAAILVITVGFFLNISTSDWLWISLAVALVFILELTNSAIEMLVDLVQPTYHPLAGKVKDMMAGAVLISAIFSVIVGLLIFTPHFLTFFSLNRSIA